MKKKSYIELKINKKFIGVFMSAIVLVTSIVAFSLTGFAYGNRPPIGNEAPVIIATDLNFPKGAAINEEILRKSITVTDKEDWHISAKDVAISGLEWVDIDEPGTYRIAYTVTDYDNHVTSTSINLFVY
ncbi:immunoglobulin-like domain-containing protein [uncultured Vagococcus sp.]|uniref:immunoglobulin-like domain-containing protein n=1 Tax=uncultured Vagococcus sp. TaxID=189676 RepID=UPI0028D891A7|nr:immunoglobulin-like domain-containing protein [uncultured Vagococcus sp.]